MSIKKMLLYTSGIALVGFAVQRIVYYFLSNQSLLFDTDLNLNPSPPAKPGVWELDES